MLHSGSSGAGLSHGWGHSVMFLGKTLYSQSLPTQSLHPTETGISSGLLGPLAHTCTLHLWTLIMKITTDNVCKVLINFFHIVNCSFVITENRNKIPQDRDWHFKFIIKPWCHTTLHNIHCTQGYLLGHVYKNKSHSFLFFFSKVGLKPNSRNILDP